MKRLFIIFVFTFLTFQSCSNPDKRKLHVPNLFTDHMVLQQNRDVAFWGSFEPNQNITVTGSWGEPVNTKSEANGTWKLELPTPKAGGPYTVNISTQDSTIVINDVMIGEVWLASGQSNMEMPLKGWPPKDPILNSEEEIKQADHPDIRMFTVSRSLSLKPLDSVNGQWLVSSPATAQNFSATAYFFAKKLQDELKVPIGIIHSSWGGTVAEAWTSKSSLRKLKDFDSALDQIENPGTFETVDAWFKKFSSQPIPETTEQWENIEFDGIAAASADYDDSQWPLIEIPGRIDLLEKNPIDGAVWIRKEFEISDISSDYLLKTGAIDDMDATYINGVKVGGLAGNGQWNIPRVMKVSKDLLKKGKNTIAIRIIDTGAGGSVHGPVELIHDNGAKVDLNGPWKHRVVGEMYLNQIYSYGLESDLTGRPKIIQMNPNLPSVLFNAMINPLVPYSIKGAIWYQGESNVGRADQYQRLFPAMINDWRTLWHDEFSFYYVQIAPYLYVEDPAFQVSQKLREAQRLSLTTPKTGMAVTLDIGNPVNIHPGNKKDVGFRLARWALAKDYDVEIVPSGPLFKDLTISKNKLILEFDHIGSGLKEGEQGLIGFEIAGSDHQFMKAQAKIVGNTVELYNPRILEPKSAQYAWRDDSIASLFNQEGLPASSFSTDSKP